MDMTQVTSSWAMNTFTKDDLQELAEHARLMEIMLASEFAIPDELSKVLHHLYDTCNLAMKRIEAKRLEDWVSATPIPCPRPRVTVYN